MHFEYRFRGFFSLKVHGWSSNILLYVIQKDTSILGAFNKITISNNKKEAIWEKK
jgi:hypothetical protein